MCHPRVSPDGRYLLYTVAAYGTFPIWHRESDQRLLDLQTGHVDSLAIVNSDMSDTYHSWSSNSRWFVFASKRDDGLYGKPYFCYIDKQGKAHKPFCLPQKYPSFYDHDRLLSPVFCQLSTCSVARREFLCSVASLHQIFPLTSFHNSPFSIIFAVDFRCASPMSLNKMTKTRFRHYGCYLLIALWGAVCWAFFQFCYPYHFFYQEQNQLFVLTRDEWYRYVSEGSGWLARWVGDFLTQFYYYL